MIGIKNIKRYFHPRINRDGNSDILPLKFLRSWRNAFHPIDYNVWGLCDKNRVGKREEKANGTREGK